jgi:hypothetical protein
MTASLRVHSHILFVCERMFLQFGCVQTRLVCLDAAPTDSQGVAHFSAFILHANIEAQLHIDIHATIVNFVGSFGPADTFVFMLCIYMKAECIANIHVRARLKFRLTRIHVT